MIINEILQNGFYTFLFGSGGVLIILLGIITLGLNIGNSSQKLLSFKNILIVFTIFAVFAILTISFYEYFTVSKSSEVITNIPEDISIEENETSDLGIDNKSEENETSDLGIDNKSEEPTHELTPPPQTQVYLSELDPYMKNEFIAVGTYHDQDNYGNMYLGKVFYNDNDGFKLDSGQIEYLLNRDYTKLSGTIYVPDASKAVEIRNSELKIFGDGVLLYEYNGLAYKDKPVNFEIDITGVEFLLLYIFSFDENAPLNCISNVKIYK